MTNILVDYGGRLHPLVVHFPIALLLLGAALEAVQLWRRSADLGRTVALVMVLGAGAAVVATVTGWLFAYQVHPDPEGRTLLAWHWWLALATALAATGAAWAAVRWGAASGGGRAWTRRALIWGTGLLLVAVAHLGALLVWGTDFFS